MLIVSLAPSESHNPCLISYLTRVFAICIVFYLCFPLHAYSSNAICITCYFFSCHKAKLYFICTAASVPRLESVCITQSAASIQMNELSSLLLKQGEFIYPFGRKGKIKFSNKIGGIRTCKICKQGRNKDCFLPSPQSRNVDKN